MGDAAALARATFAGCSANLGPLIGVELSASEVQLETTEAPPEGVLGILPLDVEVGGVPARVELASPLEDLTRLARRMLGKEDPEAKNEPGDDDCEAIGEILGVLGGAIDAALGEQVAPGLRARPRAWWRSDQPGKAAFAAGPRCAARGRLKVPGGEDVPLLLRFPVDLLERARSSPGADRRGHVLLLDLEPEAGEALARALAAGGLEVRSAAPTDSQEWREVAAAIVSGSGERGFALARQLRTGNDTWRLPVLLCATSPSRALVIRALESGASHVLALASAETEVLRVLALARGPGA